MDAFVDDLQELFEHLNVKDAMMVGHSHGGGEVTRFLSKHGTSRVKKAVLIGAVPPLMVKTSENTEGIDISVFDSFRHAMYKDRAQFFLDVASGPFFGFNRPGANKSEDFTEDLRKVNIPVLVLHGDDDQVVPIQAAGSKSAKLLPQGKVKVYSGGSHAMHNINFDEVNQDLLQFLQS
ncbi:alpha beta fold family hydrolase [Fusarium acutatum]|uniref:Alpha beta fold family hydrolase n=1 Tax=Fusarium acutatum TaxID=78861 RepID=A0A8H4JIX6_9HYPO|nr:alpha beta fold family hydrolase [Fusarium acutatum]